MPTALAVTFSPERIRTIRRDWGLTQGEVGKGVSLSQAQIARIETGRRPVTDRFVKAFAAMLGKKPAHLMSRSERELHRLRKQTVTSGTRTPAEIAAVLAGRVQQVGPGEVLRQQLRSLAGTGRIEDGTIRKIDAALRDDHRMHLACLDARDWSGSEFRIGRNWVEHQLFVDEELQIVALS